MPPRAAGGRIGYGDNATVKVGGGDSRTGEGSTGGLAGVGGARAQKPVKSTQNVYTSKVSASEKTARPTKGGGTH